MPFPLSPRRAGRLQISRIPTCRRRRPSPWLLVLLALLIAMLAASLAWRPAGLHRALSGPETADVRDDESISAAVRAALAAEPGLGRLQVEVSTQDGVVRLDGLAPHAGARERATVLAAAPAGVRRVENRLRLSPRPSEGR